MDAYRRKRKTDIELSPNGSRTKIKINMRTVEKNHSEALSNNHMQLYDVSQSLASSKDHLDSTNDSVSHLRSQSIATSDELRDQAQTGNVTAEPIWHNVIQKDYDEGMYSCSYAFLPLWNGCDEAIKATILLHNVGLKCLEKKDYSDAQVYLYKAHKVLTHYITNQPENDAVALSKVSCKIYLALGFCHYRQGRFCESFQCYENSLRRLLESDPNDAPFVALIKNAMAVVVFHCSKSQEMNAVFDPLLLFHESLEIYQSLDGAWEKEIATVMNNIGRYHYLRREYSKSLPYFVNALKIRRYLSDCSKIDLAVTVCNLGQTYHQLGDLPNALNLLQEFLDMTRKGSDHFSHGDHSVILMCIASIHQERGHLDDAKRTYEKALKSEFLSSNVVNSTIASILNKLGSVCYKLGDLSRSLTYLQEGLKIEKVLYGMQHPNVVATLLNIAQIYRDQNNFACAFLHYSHVHAIQFTTHGPDSVAISDTLFSMGLMLYRMKAYSAAFSYYQEALNNQYRHYGDADNAEIAATLNSIGIVLFHWGKSMIAKMYFEESLFMRRKIFGPSHPETAITLSNLATLNLEMGDDIFAASLYQETLKIERTAHGGKSQDVIQTLLHLGLLYQRRGELREALVYFNEALEIERHRSGVNHIFVGKIVNLIGNIHLQRGHVDKMMACFTLATEIYKMNNYIEEIVIAGHNFYDLSKLHPECAEAA